MKNKFLKDFEKKINSGRSDDPFLAGDSFGLRQGESQMPESVGGSATAQDDPIVGAVISVSECVICKPFSQKSRNKMISFGRFLQKIQTFFF